MCVHPDWTHLFVQGNPERKRAPLSTIADNTWEYVVERMDDDRLAANTYYNGKLFSTHTYIAKE